ncbi:MAG TPA: sigma-70 family RNA polymerase sigma factor [Xanthobacteraceae bacterium]|nr:sigma-70 family RNA polymerase sigma factor [Xanthobacteraceae bacterium]
MRDSWVATSNRKQNRRAADVVLIKRIASGDKAAMHMLFSNHRVPVYRFVLRRLRDKALAEDVTSEVFLEVWRQAGRFEGRSAVLTWILAIARHKAFSVRPRLDEPPFDECRADMNLESVDAPDTLLHIQDRDTLLRRCLTKLSAQHREIIDLVYYQEQSVEAVATILGIPRNTAKTRMFYARQRLADELKKFGDDYASN